MTMKMTIVKKQFKIFLLCTTFQACFCLLLFTLTGISQQFLLTFPVQGQVSAQLISRLTSFPVSTNALNHFTWSMISPHRHIHIHNKNISYWLSIIIFMMSHRWMASSNWLYENSVWVVSIYKGVHISRYISTKYHGGCLDHTRAEITIMCEVR